MRILWGQNATRQRSQPGLLCHQCREHLGPRRSLAHAGTWRERGDGTTIHMWSCVMALPHHPLPRAAKCGALGLRVHWTTPARIIFRGSAMTETISVLRWARPGGTMDQETTLSSFKEQVAAHLQEVRRPSVCRSQEARREILPVPAARSTARSG